MTMLHPLPSETALRITSMQIAELTGKDHKHVMRDIDSLIVEELNSPDLGDLNLIIESRERKTKTVTSRYFELNEDAALLLVSGYNVRLRARIIAEWHMYREAFHNRQWAHDDKEVQKRVMGTIQATLGFRAEKLDYIKANTITNKAVSNLYGFDKMLKKDDMSRPMLDDRQRILTQLESLFAGGATMHECKEIVYRNNTPKLLTLNQE